MSRSAAPGRAGVPSDSRAPRRPVVVVTRPRARARSMVEALDRLGVDSLLLPSIEIVPPRDPTALSEAAVEVARHDWIVFTSTSGVRAFRGALERHGLDLPDGPRVAAVGPSTAEAVGEHLGRTVALGPDTDFSGEGLLEAFRGAAERGDVDLEGARVLMPLAEAAADTLPDGLEALGATVRRVTAYRSVPPETDEVDAVRSALSAGGVDLLTFTSPSTATNFAEAVGPSARGVPAAVIGTVTAEAARALGYRVAVVADVQTVPGLVEDAVSWLRRQGLLAPKEGRS